jgi:glutathione S-transferase
MSLWTPGGEVPIERNPSSEPEPATQGDAGAAGMVGGPSLEDLSPEERAQAEAMIAEMAEVQRQILAAPAAQVVTNHVIGLYELAAIHLGQPEPDLEAARLAIDAMAAVMDATERRLGDDAAALRQALTQLQQVYLQMTASTER